MFELRFGKFGAVVDLVVVLFAPVFVLSISAREEEDSRTRSRRSRA